MTGDEDTDKDIAEVRSLCEDEYDVTAIVLIAARSFTKRAN